MERRDLSNRPRLIAGLGLPLRAVALMARDREERGPLVLVASQMILGTVFYVIVEGWSGVLVSFFTSLTAKTLALLEERRRARLTPE